MRRGGTSIISLGNSRRGIGTRHSGGSCGGRRSRGDGRGNGRISRIPKVHKERILRLHRRWLDFGNRCTHAVLVWVVLEEVVAAVVGGGGCVEHCFVCVNGGEGDGVVNPADLVIVIIIGMARDRACCSSSYTTLTNGGWWMSGYGREKPVKPRWKAGTSCLDLFEFEDHGEGHNADKCHWNKGVEEEAVC